MVFKRWLALFATVFLLSCAGAPPAPLQNLDSRTDELLNTYSLEQLDVAATYLTELIVAGVNGGKKPQRVLSCDPKRGVADTWMMPLKSLIDSKISRVQELYLKMPEEKRIRQWNACEKTCSCGVYGTLLQGIDESRLKPADIALRDQLLKKQGALSEKATRTCAKQAQWFCGSPLMAYLGSPTP